MATVPLLFLPGRRSQSVQLFSSAEQASAGSRLSGQHRSSLGQLSTTGLPPGQLDPPIPQIIISPTSESSLINQEEREEGEREEEEKEREEEEREEVLGGREERGLYQEEKAGDVSRENRTILEDLRKLNCSSELIGSVEQFLST